MPCYRATLSVTRVQDYDFEVEAATPEEARAIMDSEEYSWDKEDLAVNNWDEDHETVDVTLGDLEELSMPRCPRRGAREL